MTYKYLLYFGESGWGVTDKAFLITENGTVMIIKGACKDNYLPKDIIKNPDTLNVGDLSKIEYVSEGLVTVDRDIVDKIENIPEKRYGMDGCLCSLYKIDGEEIHKIWSVEDYSQIPIVEAVYFKLQQAYEKAEESLLYYRKNII